MTKEEDMKRDEGHTPGPWRAVTDDWNTPKWWVLGPPESPGGDAYIAGQLSEANARLIAAAPDLLAVALFVRERAEEFEPGYPELTALVDAALAKVSP